MSKRRDWVFTINNPGEFDDIDIERCIDSSTYLCYGIEEGESGTRHYQGFVMFTNAKHLASIKKILTRAHIEPRRGTVEQAIAYCEKDGDFHEWGERPLSKKSQKERWLWVINRAEDGDLDTIKQEEPAIYLRYLSTLHGLKRRRLGTLDGQLQNEWWYGPTGTGKSRRLHDEYPFHYPKPLNKWWDGYEDEEVVGLEEVHPGCRGWLGHFLKIWSDRYPFNAEIKGGTLKGIRPGKLIVTSNYTIEECFPDEQDHKPLKRRFKSTKFDNIWSPHCDCCDEETKNEYTL